jgi:hypothetical protein
MSMPSSAAAMPQAAGPFAGTSGGGDAVDSLAGAAPASTPVANAAQGADTLGSAILALQAAVTDLAAAVEALQSRFGSSPTSSPEQPTSSFTVDGGGADAAPTRRNDVGSAPAPTEQTRSVDVSKWVSGNTTGLHQDLLEKLAQVGEKIGRKVKIVSGFRTRAQQEDLYAAYKAGRGNLAAKPGTSNHESGNAADVNVGGTSLASDQAARKAALEAGLHFPVPGEPWHAELK